MILKWIFFTEGVMSRNISYSFLSDEFIFEEPTPFSFKNSFPEHAAYLLIKNNFQLTDSVKARGFKVN